MIIDEAMKGYIMYILAVIFPISVYTLSPIDENVIISASMEDLMILQNSSVDH